VKAGALDERPNDYSITFSCVNGETDAEVKVTLTQAKGGPAADLVSALLVTAERPRRAASEEISEPPPRLN
jgi:hypothetical protein